MKNNVLIPLLIVIALLFIGSIPQVEDKRALQQNTLLQLENCWSRKTDMPTARGTHAVATANGKIYAIGGNQSHSNFIVEEYNPTKDTWSTKSPMPAGRIIGQAIGIVNGEIYVIGGLGLTVSDAFSEVYVYDPAYDKSDN